MSMEVDNNLDVVRYVLVVENIVDNYFDKGNYRPHIGELNAMRLFWNECVKKSPWDNLGHDIVNIFELADVLREQEFIDAFTEALKHSNHGYEYTFGNAYWTAMDIVDNKKSSVGSIIDCLVDGVQRIIDVITPGFENINIDKMKELADKVKDADFASDVVDAYAKSNRIEDIAKQTPTEKEPEQKNKVASFKKAKRVE